MSGFRFRSPSLDFGCGDGMFSFLRSEGRLDESFDVFQATAGLDRFFAKQDVYDAFDEKLSPIVTSSPSYKIDVAFDHKENLLKKAGTLGLYKSFQLGDGNASLPFEDGAFASIFSNIVYWLNSPGEALCELRRILRDDGEICLMLPDVNLLQYSFYYSLHVKGGDARWAWLDLIDRGRMSDNIKQAKSSAEWERLFAKAGLQVVHHGRHLSKPIIQIWDVGLRPLFPALMKMVKEIQREKQKAIKAEWVATLRQFAAPLVELERNGDPSQAAFHCYILKPAAVD